MNNKNHQRTPEQGTPKTKSLNYIQKLFNRKNRNTFPSHCTFPNVTEEAIKLTKNSNLETDRWFFFLKRNGVTASRGGVRTNGARQPRVTL